MRFQASILLAGRIATGIQVPAELVEALCKGRQPPVRATVNGYTHRSTVAPMGEAFMLWVSAEVREVAVPPDLADALDRDPDARAPSTSSPTAASSGWCCRSSRPRPPRPGGSASPGRSRSCGRAATDRGERALPSPSRGS
jgi:hypothetical protein